MISVAICEDEPYFLDSISELLCQYVKDKKIEASIAKFISGEEFLISEQNTDIILMDIQLVNYLLKPVEPVKFYAAIDKAMERITNHYDSFLCCPVEIVLQKYTLKTFAFARYLIIRYSFIQLHYNIVTLVHWIPWKRNLMMLSFDAIEVTL